jgi:hypothetical protein
MRWYAMLFWLWVVISLGIFVWRRLNGTRHDDEAPEAPSSALTKEWAPPPVDPEAPTAGDPTSDDASPQDRPPPEHVLSPEPPPVGRPASTSIVELLEGISLPHGLVPLTQSSPTGPGSTLVAATDTAPPEDVGTALADELERLGYTITTTGDQTALAQGRRGTIEIEIHPSSSTAVDGGTLRFPTAPPGSVVVEMSAVARPL